MTSSSLPSRWATARQQAAHDAVVSKDTKRLHTAMTEFFARHPIQNVNALVRFGGYGDSDSRMTLAHVACVHDSAACLKVLLTMYGASVNAVDDVGDSLVMEAVVSESTACLRVLLKANADINRAGCHGRSALHYASMLCSTDTIRLLLDAGAELEASDVNGFTALFWTLNKSLPSCGVFGATTLLLARNAAVNVHDCSGMTPLHWACLYDMPAMVKLLLWRGAHATIVNNKGRSPGDVWRANVTGDNDGRHATETRRSIQRMLDTREGSRVMPIGVLVCDVCSNSPDDSTEPAHVVCALCLMTTHRDCYDIAEANASSSSSPWRCDLCCSSTPETKRVCALCPNLGGAFKLLESAAADGERQQQHRVVHVRCAAYFPETSRVAAVAPNGDDGTTNTNTTTVVRGVDDVDGAHFELQCMLCNVRGGACVKCAGGGDCDFTFHPSCGRLLGLREEYRADNIESYCIRHHFVPRDAPLVPAHMRKRSAAAIAKKRQQLKQKEEARAAKNTRRRARAKQKRETLARKRAKHADDDDDGDDDDDDDGDDDDDDDEDEDDDDCADWPRGEHDNDPWTEVESEMLAMAMSKHSNRWSHVNRDAYLVPRLRFRSLRELQAQWDFLGHHHLEPHQPRTTSTVGPSSGLVTNIASCSVCKISASLCQGGYPCMRCAERGRPHVCVDPRILGDDSNAIVAMISCSGNVVDGRRPAAPSLQYAKYTLPSPPPPPPT